MEIIGYDSDSCEPITRPKSKVKGRLAKIYQINLGICQLCKLPCNESDATADHKKPKQRGGGDEMTNLQLAHYWCNEIKSCHIQHAPSYYLTHKKYIFK